MCNASMFKLALEYCSLEEYLHNSPQSPYIMRVYVNVQCYIAGIFPLQPIALIKNNMEHNSCTFYISPKATYTHRLVNRLHEWKYVPQHLGFNLFWYGVWTILSFCLLTGESVLWICLHCWFEWITVYQSFDSVGVLFFCLKLFQTSLKTVFILSFSKFDSIGLLVFFFPSQTHWRACHLWLLITA